MAYPALKVRKLTSGLAKVDDFYRSAVGTYLPIEADVSAADFTVPTNIRLITSIGAGGIVMVDMEAKDRSTGADATQTNVPIPSGAFPIINVTKIKKTGTTATNIWLWPSELN